MNNSRFLLTIIHFHCRNTHFVKVRQNCLNNHRILKTFGPVSNYQVNTTRIIWIFKASLFRDYVFQIINFTEIRNDSVRGSALKSLIRIILSYFDVKTSRSYMSSFFYVLCVYSFFTCLTCSHFFVCPYFFTYLRAYIFYVRSFFYCFTCLHFLHDLHVFTFHEPYVFSLFQVFPISDVFCVPLLFVVKCGITQN